jgi:hypothetical protein
MIAFGSPGGWLLRKPGRAENIIVVPARAALGGHGPKEKSPPKRALGAHLRLD